MFSIYYASFNSVRLTYQFILSKQKASNLQQKHRIISFINNIIIQSQIYQAQSSLSINEFVQQGSYDKSVLSEVLFSFLTGFLLNGPSIDTISVRKLIYTLFTFEICLIIPRLNEIFQKCPLRLCSLLIQVQYPLSLLLVQFSKQVDIVLYFHENILLVQLLAEGYYQMFECSIESLVYHAHNPFNFLLLINMLTQYQLEEQQYSAFYVNLLQIINQSKTLFNIIQIQNFNFQMTEIELMIPQTNQFAYWQSQESYKYDKIKQQRKRMQNLKKIIENYRDRIQILNKKVQQLQFELKQAKKIPISAEGYRHNPLLFEIQKKQGIIIEQQYIIENLKREILKAYEIRGSRSENAQNNKYQSLLNDYKYLKNQLLLKEEQNLKLNQLLKKESIQNYKQEKNKEKKIQKERQKQMLIQQKSIKYGKLKQQFKEQLQIIQKYQANEQRHLQLIQMLKKQKQKICICHFRGKNRQNKKNNANNHSLYNL